MAVEQPEYGPLSGFESVQGEIFVFDFKQFEKNNILHIIFFFDFQKIEQIARIIEL